VPDAVSSWTFPFGTERKQIALNEISCYWVRTDATHETRTRPVARSHPGRNRATLRRNPPSVVCRNRA
jgi:hypothetical protein